LIYLVALVAISLIGGLWPAVLAAVGASLLLNWFFTPPLHRFTIDAPQNFLALILFVLVAVIVSATVHLSALRAADAGRSGEEAAMLLELARTVLGGDDTPSAILRHLSQTLGLSAELLERSGTRTVRVAASGHPGGAPATDIPAGADLQLRVHGDVSAVSPRVLDGYAAQLAAALERDRLRIQAAQAEALAEGNRIRTALLTAVSHDLRTPLASVKASVSSLRQTDISLPEADRAELLATIEEGADRLDALIGNLLDLSRLQTGSLRPFLRPTSLEEVAPLAMRGLEHGYQIRLLIPEDLPLLRTDPGLLDRVLANVLANALRFSPPHRPPTLAARTVDEAVIVEVVDHGSGVPAGAHELIFEPFQRLGDQHSATGVGLGLAVAKGFTEAMGGLISAVDTPGGGLTIRLRLPLADRAVVGST
jgi:two-component system sensor histidine kinase KdpD